MKYDLMLWTSALAFGIFACRAPSDELHSDRAGAAAVALSPSTPASSAAPGTLTQPAQSAQPAITLGDDKRPAKDVTPKQTKPSNVPITIKRVVMARQIENREPVDPSDAFSIADGARVYAFVEVLNPSREETELSVTFEPPEGSARGTVPLHVGASPRWRTWAHTRYANVPGTWKVTVRDAAGKVVAHTTFEMSEV